MGFFNIPERDRYPNFPGYQRTDTSIAAAIAVAPTTAQSQRVVLEQIVTSGREGLTGDETAERLNVERWSVRPRLSELKASGLIVDSKRRRKNKASGRRAIVWISKQFQDDGREA